MSTFIKDTTTDIMAEIYAGRIAAHEKHGENSIEAVPGHAIARWLPILGEEFGEVCESLTYDKDASNLRSELLDLAAVAVAWIAAIDAAEPDDVGAHALTLCRDCGHARSLHFNAARCRADRGDCICERFDHATEPDVSEGGE